MSFVYFVFAKQCRDGCLPLKALKILSGFESRASETEVPMRIQQHWELEAGRVPPPHETFKVSR